MMKVFLGVAVCSAALCLGNEPVSFETLMKALEKNNTKFQSDQLQSQIAEQSLQSAQAAYYPTLAIGANSEYSKKFNDNYTPSYVGSDSLTQSTQYQNSSTLSLTYDLFRFGATQQGVKAAQAQIKATRAKVCITLKEQLESLMETYTKARIAKMKLEYYARIQKCYQEAYVMAKRLYDAGELSQTDVVDYAQSMADQMVMQTQIQEELVSLIAQMTFLTGETVEVSTTLAPLHVNIHLSELVALPFDESAQGKQAYATIEQKEAQLKAEKTRYFPVVSLYGKYDMYGYDKESFAQATDAIEKNGYRVGLTFSWTLFDGFAREAVIETRLLELQQAKVGLVEAKRVYEKEQTLLRLQLEERQKRLSNAAQSESSSNDIALMAQALQENGQSDRLTSLKTMIHSLQSAIASKEAKELLTLNQTKMILFAQKEYECAVH